MSCPPIGKLTREQALQEIATLQKALLLKSKKSSRPSKAGKKRLKSDNGETSTIAKKRPLKNADQKLRKDAENSPVNISASSHKFQPQPDFPEDKEKCDSVKREELNNDKKVSKLNSGFKSKLLVAPTYHEKELGDEVKRELEQSEDNVLMQVPDANNASLLVSHSLRSKAGKKLPAKLNSKDCTGSKSASIVINDQDVRKDDEKETLNINTNISEIESQPECMEDNAIRDTVKNEKLDNGDGFSKKLGNVKSKSVVAHTHKEMVFGDEASQDELQLEKEVSEKASWESQLSKKVSPEKELLKSTDLSPEKETVLPNIILAIDQTQFGLEMTLSNKEVCKILTEKG